MKVFLRFAISKAVITHGLELLMGFTSIVQGVMNTIMTTAGFEKMTKTRLPEEVVTAIEETDFFASIPLWAITLIGGLFIWVLACIIFSVIARANPGFDDDLSAAAMVWDSIGQVVFNTLILVGTIKMSDRVVKEMIEP